MEKIIKEQRERHDEYDLMIGILSTFPEDGEWNETIFYEALKNKNGLNKIIKLEFTESEGKPYCESIAKIFDLLELSGLLIRMHEKIRLDLGLIKSHFETEIKLTLDENQLKSIEQLSKEVKLELKL